MIVKNAWFIILGNGTNRKAGLPDYTNFGYAGYLYNWNESRFIKSDNHRKCLFGSRRKLNKMENAQLNE